MRSLGEFIKAPFNEAAALLAGQDQLSGATHNSLTGKVRGHTVTVWPDLSRNNTAPLAKNGYRLTIYDQLDAGKLRWIGVEAAPEYISVERYTASHGTNNPHRIGLVGRAFLSHRVARIVAQHKKVPK